MTTKPVRIVLVRPLIPPNVGNIGRTCVGLGLPLWLVGQLDFDLSEKRLKRAGLDYWPRLDLTICPDEDETLLQLGSENPLMLSAHANGTLWDLDLTTVDALIFGSETKGLDAAWHNSGLPCARLPQSNGIRCYNLSNTVAMTAMEWARQNRWEPPSSHKK